MMPNRDSNLGYISFIFNKLQKLVAPRDSRFENKQDTEENRHDTRKCTPA